MSLLTEEEGQEGVDEGEDEEEEEDEEAVEVKSTVFLTAQCSHLQNIPGAVGPRGLGHGPVVVQPRPRPAVDHLPERLPELVAQEGVEDRVDAAVHVSQHVARYLEHYRSQRQRVRVQRLEHQDHLQAHVSNKLENSRVGFT